jgi:hypothetical protein
MMSSQQETHSSVWCFELLFSKLGGCCQGNIYPPACATI